MSSPEPKLLRILRAVAARAEAISQASGYFTDIGCDVRLDRREPATAELPCLQVFFGEFVPTATRNDRAICSVPLTVIGYARSEQAAPEVVGIQLLSDIQRAVELEDDTLDGLVLSTDGDGLRFLSGEVILPEFGSDAVGARVTYSVPYVRIAGNPEIA